MKTIKLTKGKKAIVDDIDFDYLNQFKWCVDGRNYAIRRVTLAPKIYKVEYMHRVVNKTPEGFETDHINHNSLDNRKVNLRTVTHHQNTMNAGFRNSNSGFKGVSWLKSRNKWLATLGLKGKTIYLGIYKKKEHAWLARRWGERLYFSIPNR